MTPIQIPREINTSHFTEWIANKGQSSLIYYKKQPEWQTKFKWALVVLRQKCVYDNRRSENNNLQNPMFIGGTRIIIQS